MNITLHIENKESGTCIPKEFNITYKMDENDLNIHIVPWLWSNKQNVHELGHGSFLKPFLGIFLQSALILPQGF
jgi:hypothetical protein